MYDFSQERLIYNNSKNTLSIKNILNKVSEITLWRFYLGVDFKLGIPFCATYRVDNNPSFNIYINPQGRILGKDFSTGFVGGIFDYLQMVYNISLYEATIKVNHDFNLELIYVNSNQTSCNYNTIKPLTKKKIKRLDILTENIISKSKKIQIMSRTYNDLDIDYWKKHNINIDILKKYDVYAIDRIYLNNQLIYTYRKYDSAYGYYFPKSKNIKIYFPKRNSFRFIGNVNNYTDIQGYYQCNIKERKCDLLVLTKSMKDVMTLRSFGINSMAIHGETHKFHEDFIRHLKKYCNKIVSLYDRDKAGIIGAKYLWDKYKIIPYFINKEFKSKDISDLYKNKGYDITKQFLNKITQ